jgi:hypothetical protein
MMAKSWQELKKELEEETKKIFETCPDEIKRFHYGIITHSDAGKYSFNQYFGHWVHLYAYISMYCASILEFFQLWAKDPDFDLKQLKKMFLQSAPVGPLAGYSGQTTMIRYAEEMVKVVDTLQTKEEFEELLGAWQIFVSRLYWWVHWYFPWGAGPALCRRLSPEDIKEIERLSQTT